MARGLLSGGAGALLLLLLLWGTSSGSSGTEPRFFPARPAASPGNGLDWFSVWDGAKWGLTKAETLTAANARWRAIREAAPAATLWRYSTAMGKWLKVAG